MKPALQTRNLRTGIHWKFIGDNSGDCFENTSANNAPSITQIATWNLGVVSGNSKIVSTRVN